MVKENQGREGQKLKQRNEKKNEDTLLCHRNRDVQCVPLYILQFYPKCMSNKTIWNRILEEHLEYQQITYLFPKIH
jgi:hypothetical protein